jgi:transposase
LLSALLLQVFYGIRSERQLMEQLDYNLLYRWFVGLSPDDSACILAARINPSHAQKTLQSGLKSPDRL